VTATYEPSWDLSVDVIQFNETDNPETSLEIKGRLLEIKVGEPKLYNCSNENEPMFKVLFPEYQMFGFYANPDIFDKDYYHFEEDHYLVSLFHYDDKSFVLKFL